MKIKNATIKDFDTAYEYIKNSGTTTPTTMKQPKKSIKSTTRRKQFCIFAIEDDGTFMDSAMEIIFRPSGCQGLPAMYQV